MSQQAAPRGSGTLGQAAARSGAWDGHLAASALGPESSRLSLPQGPGACEEPLQPAPWRESQWEGGQHLPRAPEVNSEVSSGGR